MAKYGSEQILPYNNEEHKTTQVRRMFDSIAGKIGRASCRERV